MDVSVALTEGGQLQPTVDGVTWPPLPVEVVQALAAKVDEARVIRARQDTAASLRFLIEALIPSGDSLEAQVEITAAGVEAAVDEASFDRAQRLLGVDADSAGDLRKGKVVVRKKPDETPAADPAPAA